MITTPRGVIFLDLIELKYEKSQKTGTIRINELKKQSPDRWWHDEYFDNQLRVLEDLIIGAKEKIKELERRKQ